VPAAEPKEEENSLEQFSGKNIDFNNTLLLGVK
jgi:hypothetical protein